MRQYQDLTFRLGRCLTGLFFFVKMEQAGHQAAFAQEVGEARTSGQPAQEAFSSQPPAPCAKCKDAEADFKCLKCEASFCSVCWGPCHEWGENKSHEKIALAKPTIPCEGHGLGECTDRAGAVGYCGVCDQALCDYCWVMLHGKGTLVSHEKLGPLGRTAFLEEQKAVCAAVAGEVGGPLSALADFDPKKAPPWVAGIISNGKQIEHARMAGLEVSKDSASGAAPRASAGTTQYNSIQAQAVGSIAEQLQRVCNKPGSGAYTDATIKAFAADRQEDVKAIAAASDMATRKTPITADSRNKTLLDKVLSYESAIKVALANGKTVALNKDERGKQLDRMATAISVSVAQMVALQVSTSATACGLSPLGFKRVCCLQLKAGMIS